MCELLPVPVAAVFLCGMKGLRFRLFNTQPGNKAALKEEERRRDREETGEWGGVEECDGKGIGVTVQRQRRRWYRDAGL